MGRARAGGREQGMAPRAKDAAMAERGKAWQSVAKRGKAPRGVATTMMKPTGSGMIARCPAWPPAVRGHDK